MEHIESDIIRALNHVDACVRLYREGVLCAAILEEQMAGAGFWDIDITGTGAAIAARWAGGRLVWDNHNRVRAR